MYEKKPLLDFKIKNTFITIVLILITTPVILFGLWLLLI